MKNVANQSKSKKIRGIKLQKVNEMGILYKVKKGDYK
jgi:hypothetical protein